MTAANERKAGDPPPAPDCMDLRSIQSHIHNLCAYHEWDGNSAERIFMLLTEEVGEVAKALRRLTNTQHQLSDPQKLRDDLGEELADCLMYLADLANHFDVDLEQAYRRKTVKNSDRVWTE